MTRGAELAQLRESDLRIVGRFAEASNLTLLAETDDGLRCVYKPVAGERPLWDFPNGTLARRETATGALDEMLGWGLVPPTVLREDGPYGAGVCQVYVEAGPSVEVDLVPAAEVPAGWLIVGHGESESGQQVALVHRDSSALRRLSLLDVLANNADRKGSHILTDAAGRVWGIDHGLTFHSQDKLRTVLWGFADQAIAEAETDDLRRLAADWDGAAQALAQLLAASEVRAARERLDALLTAGSFPQPAPGWPRLPWPAL